MSEQNFTLTFAAGDGAFKQTIKFQMLLDPAIPSDLHLMHYLANGNLPEPEVTNTLPMLLRKGDYCIDAGANIGFFSLLMSRLVGDDGRVVAVEADPRNFVKLCRNLDLNNIKNVRPVEAALSDREGTRTFYCYEENGMSGLSQIDSDAGNVDYAGALVETHDVQATTLANLSAAFSEKQLKLVKMDIEGGEYDALKSALDFPFLIAEINAAALARFNKTPNDLMLRAEEMPVFERDRAPFIMNPFGHFPAYAGWLSLPEFAVKLIPQNANSNLLFAPGSALAEALGEAVYF